jgi:hypothetical protein
LERAIAALGVNPLRGFVFDKPSPTAATMVSGSSHLALVNVRDDVSPGVLPTSAPVLQLLETVPAGGSNNDQLGNLRFEGNDTVDEHIFIDETHTAAAPSSAQDTGNSQHIVTLDFSFPETQLQRVIVYDMEKLKQAWLARAQEVAIEDSSFTHTFLRLGKNSCGLRSAPVITIPAQRVLSLLILNEDSFLEH